MSTRESPVTHTADVAVKNAVINDTDVSLLYEIGNTRSIEPIRIMLKYTKAII